ncbi:response regulator of zinc sigma-54-dependent two-component system [Aquipluma nitroreducens]|uniref:Response regulator of zinc sigma-54-dependent two-component system n=2 Tax=Aquipluma nitroreducens TaxID=2010828 RepID=A0A5K7S449_9BACT|nr:response regulator of zinc sigma-54-dependent two-component system [Aquipluma nitroreducens]
MELMEKILVIDDNKLIRKTLREILSKVGYTIIEAGDGETGLQLVRSEHPELVITDYQMPGISGLEVLSEIRKLKVVIPVLLLTSFGHVVLTIKAIQLGAFDFLEKPVDPSLLKSTVQLALNSVKVSNSLNAVPHEDTSSESMPEDNIMVSRSPRMKEIFKNIGRISMNKVNVLIEGETGTGKELIARLIHFSGTTSDKPLVVVNCSALTETLLESELFGHVKGSFTDSIRDKKGKFELAGEGSIFLDEISEISLNTQVKLLRVIQELEFERVGGEATIPMKARIIAATNRSLEKLIEQGKFREDLYYRLKVFTINLPPLRERKEDIRDLVNHFMYKLDKQYNKNVIKVGDGVIEMLQQHDWHGNVRELKNTILQAIIMSKNDVLEKENITINVRIHDNHADDSEMSELLSLADMEKNHIRHVLDVVKWNKLDASRILNITRPTLNAKIEKYNLVQ